MVLVRLPVFPSSAKIERRNDLSPSFARACEIILFPKRGPTILLHPHRSPTVELALVVAKVAAGVFEKGEEKQEDEEKQGLQTSRSESNSNRASCEDKLGCLSTIYVLAMYKG